MSDNYPSDDDLKRLREWDYNDMRGWFDFAQSVGNYWPEDRYWTEEPEGVFHISTGGWSGNEDIIDAMAENFSCWAETWVMRRRGGHYEFKLPAMGTSFEQQISDALKGLLTPLTHEYGGKAEYYADVIAPRIAAAIDEASRNTLSVETARAAGLTALRGVSAPSKEE